MRSLLCLWVRPRVGRGADGALEGQAARIVAAHLGRCAECQAIRDRAVKLKALIRQAVTGTSEPPWGGFWNAVHARILREDPKPLREPWWLPYWKPVWGHPHLAFGSALLAVLIVGFSLWPADDAAFASSVTVQDVTTEDADRSVMVYSNRKEDVTVIWVFGSNQGYDPEGDAP
jgi:anti-sigma factor RsiW